MKQMSESEWRGNVMDRLPAAAAVLITSKNVRWGVDSLSDTPRKGDSIIWKPGSSSSTLGASDSLLSLSSTLSGRATILSSYVVAPGSLGIIVKTTEGKWIYYALQQQHLLASRLRVCSRRATIPGRGGENLSAYSSERKPLSPCDNYLVKCWTRGLSRWWVYFFQGSPFGLRATSFGASRPLLVGSPFFQPPESAAGGTFPCWFLSAEQ